MVNVKGLIFFFSGLVLGAAGGGYLAYKYTKGYYERENEAAALERAEYYHNKYNDIPVKEVQITDASPLKGKSFGEVEAKEEKDTYEEISGIYKPDESNKVVTDYHSISGSGNTDSRPSTKKKGKKKKPYVISEEIFNENVQDYDKCFLNYYEVDNVFIDDETDEQLEDIMDDIGSNNLFDADDKLIVANDQTKTMYNITIIHAAWSEEGL